MKIRCVKNSFYGSGVTFYDEGGVYELRKDGYLSKLNGQQVVFNKNNSFEEFQKWSSAKWELITEQTLTKEELEDGDICVLRDNREAIVFKNVIILPNGSVIRETQSDLKNRAFDNLDIMEVYRNKELIYKREEKSAQQIEIENIQSKMEKLNKRLEVLKGEM